MGWISWKGVAMLEIIATICNIASFCFVSGMVGFMIIFIAIKILRGDGDDNEDASW